MQFSNFSTGLTERVTALLAAGLLFVFVAACSESRDADTSVPPGPMMADDPLKGLVTVSGVSAGGYMAVQVHLAYANRIGGVAAIAGGPWDCANGSIKEVLGPCMKGEGIDVAAMQERAAEAAAAGEIASADAIADAKVWLFHSPSDSVVDPRVSDALANFYTAYVPEEDIHLVKDVSTAHGWPTLSAGLPCEDLGGDFINACDYDAAGELLHHLYEGLSDRAPEAAASRLRDVDVSGYFSSGSDVAKTAYMYVPAACEATNAKCRLHINFHGCKQGAEFVDDRFVRQIGLNEWAESNDIIVVYPQVEKSMFNPNGCWDWWGYTDENYANRSGPQIAGVASLIDAYARSELISPQ